jgi:hypothetical protein
MEILDPDLWNDDGTPKRPSKEYMESLAEAQQGDGSVFLSFARIKREAKQERGPEIGDIVHFWGGKEDPAYDHCFAAIVMEVESFTDVATIRVHVPHEAFMDWHVDHDEDKGHDTWHWPCGEGR